MPDNTQVFYETPHFILSSAAFHECKEQSERLGIDLDYFVFEFCNIDNKMIGNKTN